MKTKYNIVRMYQRRHHDSEVIKTGLTLEEAQTHCRNEETSSSTCKGKEGLKHTQAFGAWFDGYEKA